jgi:hypothetical protein
MMLTEALTADGEGRTQDAASAYEAALLSNPLDLVATMNLVVLYWHATDYGVSATEHLPREFIALAGNRFRELLEAARVRFPDRPEVLFWTRYIAWADLGEPFEPAECRKLLFDHPEYLEPVFVLFARSAGVEAEAEAMQLLDRCSKEQTTRCRYIVSVIRGVLKRRPRNSGPS